MLVATDGYTDGLLPELDARIASVRGEVVATEPVPDVLPCPMHGRWGYDYVQQLANGRLVAGGRRDLDLDTVTGRVEATTEPIQAGLEALLAELLGATPPITPPLVGPLRENVWVSAGYSGHGNVLGFACGEAVAAALLGRPEPWSKAFSPERTPAAPPPA